MEFKKKHQGVNKRTLTKPEFDEVALNLMKEFTSDLREIDHALNDYDLAKIYATSLFDKILKLSNAPENKSNATSEKKIIDIGAALFYDFAKTTLGPIFISFVDSILNKYDDGILIFPARDATPFYMIAKELIKITPKKYSLQSQNIENAPLNKTILGLCDKQKLGTDVLDIDNPLVRKFLAQLGFFSDQKIVIVDTAGWGGTLDIIKNAMSTGKIPQKNIELLFFHSSNPNIYGYLNDLNTRNNSPLSDDEIKTMADTTEVVLKNEMKCKKLLEKEGRIEFIFEKVDSYLLRVWTKATLDGFKDAANDFAIKGNAPSYTELIKLKDLIKKANEGEWTGMLPFHTCTWSRGNEFVGNWRWGKITPK
jgi:hypothetical protein